MVKAKSERKRENKLVDFFFSVVVILFYFILFDSGLVLFLFNQTAQTTKRDSQIAHICTPKNKCVNFFFFFGSLSRCVCVCECGKCAVSYYTKKIFACVAKFNYHGCKNIYFNNQCNVMDVRLYYL